MIQVFANCDFLDRNNNFFIQIYVKKIGRIHADQGLKTKSFKQFCNIVRKYPDNISWSAGDSGEAVKCIILQLQLAAMARVVEAWPAFKYQTYQCIGAYGNRGAETSLFWVGSGVLNFRKSNSAPDEIVHKYISSIALNFTLRSSKLKIKNVKRCPISYLTL